MIKSIYLDHNATTHTMPQVCTAVIELMKSNLPLNASSVHAYGRYASAIVENARKSLLQSLSVANQNNNKSYNVIFTSGGTEANNLALNKKEQYLVLTSSIEHASVLEVAEKSDIECTNSGIIDLDDLEKKLKKYGEQSHKKILLSVMLANNEIGVINPIKEISKIAKQYNALLHVDACQAIGKIQVDLPNLGADFFTISGHKFGAPQGVGALIYNTSISESDINPLLRGGGQEKNLRAGTMNALSIYGLDIACQNLTNFLAQMQKIASLRDYMEGYIKQISQHSVVFGDTEQRLPNTTSITMPGIKAETQVAYFDTAGIAVSAGSACSSKTTKESKIQMNMGYPREIAETAIRITLGITTTLEEIEIFIQKWKQLFKKAMK